MPVTIGGSVGLLGLGLPSSHVLTIMIHEPYTMKRQLDTMNHETMRLRPRDHEIIGDCEAEANETMKPEETKRLQDQ